MCGVNYFQIFNKKESDLWLGVTNLGTFLFQLKNIFLNFFRFNFLFVPLFQVYHVNISLFVSLFQVNQVNISLINYISSR